MSSTPTSVPSCLRTLHALHTPKAMTALGVAAVLALAGCGSSDHDEHAGHDAAPSAPAADASAAPSSASSSTSSVAVGRAWAKALPEPGKMGMTAVFGEVTNRGSKPVTITSATTSASDHAELHKTEGGKMAPVPSFTVPAGGTLSLKPGGDHVMVMGVMKPIRPGDVVTVTLSTSDGQKIAFSAVAKTFTGAGETYSS